MFDDPDSRGMIGSDPRFSVSEFVAIFNQSLDMLYPVVGIVGEISNFRVSKGKWVYFDLKDEYSSVKFFGSVFNLPGPLEDGITVEVYGRPRLHNLYGFSVNYTSVRATGEGSIRKAQDLLLQKLESEGLFAPERKRVLPYPPARIGLITSAESAAIADFRKIITARWPSLQIELIDSLVQGAAAPAAIVRAIQDFNMQSNPPELLVIIRGGGSADDLAAFSEESVVRAVSASRLPTLVAIGHENDLSLAELAADKRASTPSNAAELLVPDVATERMLAANARQSLNELVQRLFRAQQQNITESKETLRQSIAAIIKYQAYDIANKQVLLSALDPRLPLKLGFALIRDNNGKHLKKATLLKKDAVVHIEMSDATKQAYIID